MPIRRRTRPVQCHQCAVTLGSSDRDHYGYQCHACALREHDLIRLMARDPDHPDVAWLETSPVDLGLAPPATLRRAA